MSSWGNNDNAANAPYWAVNSTIVNAENARSIAAAPTAANVAKLYANTTADVYTVGETIGLFGVDANEADVNGNGTVHTGWVLRTTGSGGRAGRVQQEVLVALSEMKSDGDQQVYPNVAITISGPSSTTVAANTGFNNVAILSITTSLAGITNATLTYQWQYDNSGTWANIPANTANVRYANATTPSLHIRPADNTTANGELYRVIVTAAAEGVTATSANATLTIM
jgi:hypothetical protein